MVTRQQEKRPGAGSKVDSSICSEQGSSLGLGFQNLYISGPSHLICKNQLRMAFPLSALEW